MARYLPFTGGEDEDDTSAVLHSILFAAPEFPPLKLDDAIPTAFARARRARGRRRRGPAQVAFSGLGQATISALATAE